MLIALSPTDALRTDLARVGRFDADSDADAHGGAFARWLRVATVVYRLAQLPADERAGYAHGAARLWPVVDPVLGGPEFGSAGPTDRFADALTAWSGGLASVVGIEAVQAEVEDMERGGALSLAFATLGALRAVVDAESVQYGFVLAHQGRVARQLGELQVALDLYAIADQAAERLADSELAARAAIGVGIVAVQRGNYPDARSAFVRALMQAPAGSPLAGQAHHGLMLAATAASDFDTAFSHGWQAFDDALGDAARRAELLINLATLCQKVGQEYAALRAYRAGLSLSSISRLRLPALRGALRSAAQLGRRTLVSSLVTETEAEIARAADPYECSRAWLDLAEVHAVLENPEVAEQCVARARALASEYGYHEIAWRADHRSEQLAEQGAAAASASGAHRGLGSSPTAPYPLADESLVVIARLTALPLGNEALAAHG